MQSMATVFFRRAVRHPAPVSGCWASGCALFSASMAREEPELVELLDYMERLKNYERLGVPRDAGTDSDDGFDLGRMRRLLKRLGDPQFNFPVSCSEIATVSNIFPRTRIEISGVWIHIADIVSHKLNYLNNPCAVFLVTFPGAIIFRSSHGA